MEEEGWLTERDDGVSTACRMRLEGFLAKDLDLPMKLGRDEGEEREPSKVRKRKRGRVEEEN